MFTGKAEIRYDLDTSKLPEISNASMSGAFDGSESRKRELVRVIQQFIARDKLTARTLHWDEKQQAGSAICCITNSGDIRDYSKQTGYPAALCSCIEPILEMLRPDKPAFDAFAIDWFEKVAPSADLSSVATTVVLYLLDDVSARLGPFLKTELVYLYNEVREYHLALPSERPDLKSWNAVRMKTAPHFYKKERDLQVLFAEFIHDICWPLHAATVSLEYPIANWFQLRSKLFEDEHPSDWSTDEEMQHLKIYANIVNSVDDPSTLTPKLAKEMYFLRDPVIANKYFTMMEKKSGEMVNNARLLSIFLLKNMSIAMSSALV